MRYGSGTLFLLVLALTCRLGFLLTADGRFLIVFSLSQFGEDAGFCTLSFETTERIVKRFVLFYLDFHFNTTLPPSSEP